jgi:hypothetical protein
MTIAIAWIRKIRDCEELLFVSDSRLSGDGTNFDACPKVMILPRGDCAIAFAGYTGHAYPMMQQLAFAIESHGPLQRGSMDISALKSHALKIFDSMIQLIESSPHLSSPEEIKTDANFILGGYPWIKKRFEIWNISYRAAEKRFIAQPAEWLCYSVPGNKVLHRGRPKGAAKLGIGRIAFAGDQAPLAKALLIKSVYPRSNSKIPTKLDMEPFQVVRDMLRDPQHSETIGGAPQLAKVYQYMKAAPLAVYWKKKKRGRPHLLGRPCLGYERIDRWALDPDTLKSEMPIPMDEYEIEDADSM